jgi:hydrogenase expression/formation protein HypD
MTEVDLLRDPRAVGGLLAGIRTAAERLGRPTTVMEVCGTHTHAVAGAGLRRMLPEAVRLISGPGCPVCVTPVDYLDRAVALAALPDTTVCTFGDLMRVPSSTTSLERARAAGHRVEVVYSPRDAVELAAARPHERVVFLAVGFETTAPTIAGALAESVARGLRNFLILPGNKVMPPPLRALAADPDVRVDGFLLPGHVSVVTGADAFRFLAREHGVSGVVSGFTPTDILRGVLALLDLLAKGEAQVLNLYGRAVTAEGNRTARALVDRFFTPATSTWRGFGSIPASGLALRSEWYDHDAAAIPVELPAPVEPAGCRCGDVLRGAVDPPQCPLFGAACTPDNPVGACMVSSEGTCAAWYRHQRT